MKRVEVVGRLSGLSKQCPAAVCEEKMVTFFPHARRFVSTVVACGHTCVSPVACLHASKHWRSARTTRVHPRQFYQHDGRGDVRGRLCSAECCVRQPGCATLH
eukprot:5934164-Pleurochrysis_carterae.AAC.1